MRQEAGVRQSGQGAPCHDSGVALSNGVENEMIFLKTWGPNRLRVRTAGKFGMRAFERTSLEAFERNSLCKLKIAIRF